MHVLFFNCLRKKNTFAAAEFAERVVKVYDIYNSVKVLRTKIWVNSITLSCLHISLSLSLEYLKWFLSSNL